MHPAEITDPHRFAFERYVREGIEDAKFSSPDGGVLLPIELEYAISQRLSVVSPIRSIAGVRPVMASRLVKPVLAPGGWGQVEYPTGELYAMPAATTAFLGDAAVDVGEWIGDEVNAAFAEQETAAFVNGNGVEKPRGFLHEECVLDSGRQPHQLGAVEAPEITADVLIDLVYTLKAGYRQNASWVMNRKTQGAVRKLKDAEGNYLWSPGVTAGAKPTLLGFELVEAEDMPNIGAGTTPIAFGDFRRGYLVVDRTGVNVLRDPYSAKPYVLFYTTKRVGGGVQDFDAIKLLKVA